MRSALLALLALTRHALTQTIIPIDAPPMMRFQCSQLVIDRLDPLVFPGAIPSPHLHQIVGGNSFTPDMSHPGHDLVNGSSCTSCTFSEDFSNYWTAVLYFRARNGTFKRVPQFESEYLTGNGGITVYYIPDAENKMNVTAFQPGFRMVVGDALTNKATSDKKVCHRCMPKTGDVSWYNCAGEDKQSFPQGMCEGGIRSVITFPTCWDGVNLDSRDHMSHVVYPEGYVDSGIGPTGKCPESHPVVIPQVMYEVMWDVSLSFLPWVVRVVVFGCVVFTWIRRAFSLTRRAIDETLQRPEHLARRRFAALCLQQRRSVGFPSPHVFRT
jgi:hypothetical protein